MIHLVTLVGSHVNVLPHMLEHYRSLGIESFFVNLHLASDDDPVREQVEEITRAFGCGVATVTVGNWQLMQQAIYLKQREQYPSDWFILADQDELQVYPANLRDVIADCGRWDYIRGCFVDRIARDGGFPEVDPAAPIWDQYPLGGCISLKILNADPRKVAAVRGPVSLKKGNHHAHEGRACPSRDYYIPIHHFKWTANIVERLAGRAEALHRGGFAHWGESACFVEYTRSGTGRIPVDDPELYIAECAPEYPHWEKLKKIALSAPVIL